MLPVEGEKAVFREKIRELGKKSPFLQKLLGVRLRLKFRNRLTSLANWKRTHPAGVFLLLTPQHCNLGDHAIALAEIQLLQEMGIAYYEITGRECLSLLGMGGFSLLDGAVLLINGGGNLGTLWPEWENAMRRIVLAAPHSAIFFLPNTIYYDHTPAGQQSLRESIRVYGAHPALHFYAREQASYDFMKAIYPTAALMPDMALTLHPPHSTAPRAGCLLLLRNDREKTITPAQSAEVMAQCHRLFGENVTLSDMDAPAPVSPAQREAALREKWTQLAGAALVITDRLHGMIFSALTETPCIALDSKSPKLRGCYEWMRKLDYIAFADSPADIGFLYERLKKAPRHYDNADYLRQMQPLRADILQAITTQKGG